MHVVELALFPVAPPKSTVTAEEAPLGEISGRSHLTKEKNVVEGAVARYAPVSSTEGSKGPKRVLKSQSHGNDGGGKVGLMLRRVACPCWRRRFHCEWPGKLENP
jgi:hypothetical protein